MTSSLRVLSVGVVMFAAACGGGKKAPVTVAPADAAAVAVAVAPGAPPPAALTPGMKGALRKNGGPIFNPSTEGFKFQNYGNEEGYENLTAVELKRLFGPTVCAYEENGVCTLTPPAEKWMDSMNDDMNGGHCEGMAALAVLFEQGKLSPKDFGADSTFALSIEGNKKLQHEIALWFSTQGIEPMASAEDHTLTPTALADKLTAAFQSGAESYVVGLYQPDGSEGHAVTPFAVVDKGNDRTWILVYDNNYPGDEKHIEIDRARNSWRYFTASNPNEEGSEYTGDADTFTLTIAPTSVRTGKLECPFCGEVGDDDPGEGKPAKGAVRRQVVLDGNADLLITDEHGKRVGDVGGKVVNEIPDAKVVFMKAGARASHHEPLYELPPTGKLTVTLDGSTLKKQEQSDVALFGPGYTLGVYDVALEPGEKDTIEFSADWSHVIYTTEKDETPELEIGIETPAADYEFTIHAGGESDGQKLELGLDLKAGTLAVQATAKDGSSTYSVEIHRFAGDSEQVFRHKGLSIGASDKLLFKYKDWKGNKQAMDVGVDKGGDGSVDETESVADED